MKSTTKATLFGAFITSAAFIAVPAIVPHPATAAEAQADEPKITGAKPAAIDSNEQYKVMSLAPYQNDANVHRMEEALNRLAAEGWKVRTGVGVAIVLAK